MARRLNIDGDGQGDLRGHGGVNRAVLVYQLESYRHWQRELGRPEFPLGQFGENFTVDGLPDREVCIGDRYRIGRALFEVSQPRATCYRVGLRMDEPRMAALLVSHRRPGFYLRVLEEGDVGAGDEIVKVADGPERMTVAEIDALLYLPGHRREDLERALRIPRLEPGLAALVSRPAGSAAGRRRRQRRALAAERPGPRLAGIPSSARRAHRSGEPDGVLADPDAARRARARDTAAGTVRRRTAATGRGRGAAASQLLAFRRARGGSLPPQRQAGTARRGQRLPARARARRGQPGGERAERRVHAAARRAAGRSAQRRRRRHAGAGHAARARRDRARRARSGGCTAPATARSIPLRASATPCCGSLPAVAAISHTARRRPRIPWTTISMPAGAWIRLRSPALACRGKPISTCAGPLGSCRTSRESFAAGACRASRIHSENFGSGTWGTPGIGEQRPPPHAPAGPPGEGPRVSFARSGLSVDWHPRFQSLLDLAEACDVPVQWACRTGVCHSCEVGLIGGSVAYEPDPLEPPASGNLLICCSRPRGDVVIDL